MSRGVTLIALDRDRPMYCKWAYNIAVSIKRHSPGVKIQLICNDLARKGLDRWVFDVITPIETEHYTDGKFSPAKAKIYMYQYLAFDKTIYLDVDGVVIRDLNDLFDLCEGHDFLTHVVGQADRKRLKFPEMQWADKSYLWDRYDIPEDAIMPATNSSFQYIKKGEKAAALFALMQKCFKNKVPNEDLTLTWGKGKQPDELYLNVALAKLGMMPKADFPVMVVRNGTQWKQSDRECFCITLFGGRQTTHGSVWEQADREMRATFKEMKLPYRYKLMGMRNTKYANGN